MGIRAETLKRTSKSQEIANFTTKIGVFPHFRTVLSSFSCPLFFENLGRCPLFLVNSSLFFLKFSRFSKQNWATARFSKQNRATFSSRFYLAANVSILCKPSECCACSFVIFITIRITCHIVSRVLSSNFAEHRRCAGSNFLEMEVAMSAYPVQTSRQLVRPDD